MDEEKLNSEETTDANEIDGKVFTISEEVRSVATKVIKEENLDLRPAKLEYMLVHPNISKTVIGKCIRANKELKFFSGVDYIIEISGEVWPHLDDNTKYLLVLHELLHVNPVYNEKQDKWTFKVADHDVKDFYKIIKKHGVDWFTKVKTITSSLYDMSPAEEDNIKL